jgi:hypothetical protein
MPLIMAVMGYLMMTAHSHQMLLPQRCYYIAVQGLIVNQSESTGFYSASLAAVKLRIMDNVL